MSGNALGLGQSCGLFKEGFLDEPIVGVHNPTTHSSTRIRGGATLT